MAVALAAAPVSAAVLVQTASYSISDSFLVTQPGATAIGLSANQQFTLAPFDPLLGTLTGVRLDITAHYRGVTEATSTGDAGASLFPAHGSFAPDIRTPYSHTLVDYSVLAGMLVSAQCGTSSGSPPCADMQVREGDLAFSLDLGAIDGIAGFNAPNDVIFGAAFYAPFDSPNITIGDDESSAQVAAGLQIEGDFRLTYTYTPADTMIPSPPSIWILLAGIASLAGFGVVPARKCR